MKRTLKLGWIFLLALLALGLDLFFFVRKPTPWREAVPIPLMLVGLMLAAWSGLLPAAKTGARRILIGLALVCAAAALVLEIFFRS